MQQLLASCLLAVALLPACAADGAFPGCPVEGHAVRSGVRALNRLKNRATAPAAWDIDSAVSLPALVAPGDDRRRWSERRAATIVGYVRAVQVGGVETVNCSARTPDHRDTHIEIVTDPADAGQLPLIVEVTPWWREHAARAGADWSTDALRAALEGRWVRVTGWLLFDGEHQWQAENTAPGRVGNWRATAWELHPVSAVVVVAQPPP
jgi:hypothetical protein